jgi:predicted TIM-barrel fold metal-dependent hydrolase
MNHHRTRREFLVSSSMALLAAAARGAGPLPDLPARAEPIIDVHQHTNYHLRTDDDLAAHQKAMGVSKTVLLPAGAFYGLEANVTGNQAAYDFTLKHPGEYVYFANEISDLPGARTVIEWWLKKGAIGIGEQKFNVESDSPAMEGIAELAREYKVPVLMHFQHNVYNTRIERFHKMLEKFPEVAFIGHAQTWWANIDKNCDQKVLYPKGKVTPGGLSDRLLSDYPNMYCDLSAGSGLGALTRDKEFTRGFLERHQDKLLFGSDCEDMAGHGPGCIGATTIATVRELAPSKAVERKLLYENAKKLLKL